jgi:hypothetical protein
MSTKNNVSANILQIINQIAGKESNKPISIFLAIQRKEKNIAFVMSLEGKVKAFGCQLPELKQKESWSYKAVFTKIAEQCKQLKLENIRLYIADQYTFKMMKIISATLARTAKENGLKKLDICFIKDGFFKGEYQIAEHLVCKIQKKGIPSLNEEFDSLEGFGFLLDSPTDYHAKLLFKKPRFVGKKFANHKKEKTMGLTVTTTASAYKFKQVTAEILGLDLGLKQKAAEVIKYLNDVIYVQDVGFVAIDSSTIREWSMEWLEKLSSPTGGEISLNNLEHYLGNKVREAINHIKHIQSEKGFFCENSYKVKIAV